MSQWYHVIPVIDREAGEGSRKVLIGWAIKGEDNERISNKYRHLDKRKVVEKAKNKTHTLHPGVVIHNNNGRVVDIWVNSDYTTQAENDYTAPKPNLFPDQYEDY